LREVIFVKAVRGGAAPAYRIDFPCGITGLERGLALSPIGCRMRVNPRCRASI
jgi:hypothetical protein